MPSYKCRAECRRDAEEWQKVAGDLVRNVVVKDVLLGGVIPIPDVDIDFESDASLQHLCNTMASVSDAHVMWETVQPSDQYTGEREDRVLSKYGTVSL